MTRGYSSTNRAYVDVTDLAGRDRKRTKLCPHDGADLAAGVGTWLACPACGRTADELEQVTR
jgi:hypothetical protein